MFLLLERVTKQTKLRVHACLHQWKYFHLFLIHMLPLFHVHGLFVASHCVLLNGTAKFERADVFALTEHEQQTLGDESQGSEEFVLRPGETRTVTRELKKGGLFS